jgi:uncharacterized membrane protein
MEMYLGGDDMRIALVGLLLVFIGLVLVVLGMLSSMLRGGGKAEGGAVIIIGPIPIVVASSPGAAKALMVLGIVLTAAVILLYMLYGRGTG